MASNGAILENMPPTPPPRVWPSPSARVSLDPFEASLVNPPVPRGDTPEPEPETLTRSEREEIAFVMKPYRRPWPREFALIEGAASSPDAESVSSPALGADPLGDGATLSDLQGHPE